MTRRIAEVVIKGVRYPRFGHGRCDECARSRLLFYATPKLRGPALCARCIEKLAAAEVRP